MIRIEVGFNKFMNHSAVKNLARFSIHLNKMLLPIEAIKEHSVRFENKPRRNSFREARVTSREAR